MATQMAALLKAKVVTEGLDKAVDQSKEFNKNMNQGAAAVKKAALSASAPSKAVAAARQESQDYGVTRSLRPGGTGASARDFAQEAQGLGGLVRLYATYAANIFAVGAAFRALSNAMDTSNMVKGLDQLGAASGMALGSLSKQLVSVTDGAISLREAMESVAKASSSGMSGDNILRMGKVAKQASQALGVDMADAVNRLTRGITKLEPELLDEVGIFTRVDSATQAYAKSIGKSTSALTDFEKRMAFANAVLDEGERKFSAINIDTNPYTKLVASIKDAAQTGLELVNKVLSPIVNILSQSPTALMAVLGSLGLMLVKQALPAIGEFKAGLENAATRATDISIKKAEDASAARQKLSQVELLRIEDMAEVEIAALDNADAKYKALDKSKIDGSKKVKALLKKDISEITEAELVSAEKTARSRSLKNKDSAALRTAELDVITGIRNVQAAEENYAKKSIENQKVIANDAKTWGTYGLTVRAALNAKDSATKSSIISNAAYNGSLIGLRGSMALMREEIAKSGLQLNTFQKAMLTSRGAIAAFGGMMSTVAGAISGAFMWFGLIVSVLGVLDSMFSKSAKELGEFDTAVSSVESTTKTLSDTFKLAIDTNPFTPTSLQAQAKAISEFGNSIYSLGNKAREAYNSLSGWDKVKDTFKSAFGFGVKAAFQDALSTGLKEALDTMDSGALKISLLEDLNKILGTTGLSVEGLAKHVKSLDPNSEAVKLLEERMKALGIETSNTASKSIELIDSIKQTEDALKDVGKTFELKDPITKFAISSITSLNKLNEVLDEDIGSSIGSINKMLKSLETLPLFGSQSNKVYEYSASMRQYEQDLVRTGKEIKKLEEAKKRLESEGPELKDDGFGNQVSDVEGWRQQQADITQQIAALQNFRSDVQRAASSLAAKIKEEVPAGMSASIGIVAKQLNAELAKGSTVLLQGLYSRLDTVPELAGRQYDLKVQELQVESSLLEIQKELLKATQTNALEVAVNSAELKKQNALKVLETATAPTPSNALARTKATEDLNSANSTLDELSKPLALMRKAFTDPVGAAKELQSALAAGDKTLGAYIDKIVGASSAAAGLAAKQRAIAQQVQLIKAVEKPIAEEEARNKQKLQNLKLEADTNAEKLKSLGYAYQQGKVDEDSYLLQKEDLDILQARNITSQAIQQSLSEYNKQYIIAAELAKQGKQSDAEKVLTTAAVTYGQQAVLAISKEQNTVTGIGLNTDKERQAILDRKLSLMQELRDIEFSIKDLQYGEVNAQIDLDVARLQRAKEVGTIGEVDYLNTKLSFELTKERLALEQKLQNDALVQAKKIEQLERQWVLEKDEIKKAEIKQRIDAEETSFVQRTLHETNLSDLRKKGIIEAIQFEKDARKRDLEKSLADSLVIAITKGSKAGIRSLRENIVKELQRQITIKVNAQVSTSKGAQAVAGIQGSVADVMAGYQSYNLGPSLVTGATEIGGFLKDAGLYDLGDSLENFGSSIAGYTKEISMAGGYFSAFTTALDGDYGAAIGEALGVYFMPVLGPLGPILGKLAGSLLGLTDDSGTFHTGGAGSYSTTQGKRTGTEVEQLLNFNLGENISEAAEASAGTISQSLVEMFDGVAEAFGLEAGYYAATAFADDTSKDGAWGALMVKLGDKVLVDWESGTDKWPGREFADGAEGQKQYLDALAKDTVTVLKEMDLPAWADSILASLGESPTFEKLQVAMAQINALNGMFDTFSTSLGWAREGIEGLIGPLGGIQAGTQLLASYYQNFYTESERLAISTDAVKEKLADLGQEMPSSREGFRAMVEAARAAGDETLLANLLKIAPAFAEVTAEVDETINKLEELASSVSLTADSLSQIMIDGFMNGVDGAEIGKMIANTIQRGMYQAMISGVTNSIAEMVMSSIVSPMLQSIIASGTIVGAVSQTTIDGVVSKATQMIQALAQVLNSPEFQSVISSLGSLANISFGGISVPAAYQYSQPGPSAKDKAEDARNEALKAVDAAFNALKKAIDAEKKLIQDQIKLAEENLDKLNALIDVLDSSIKELRGSVDSTAALQAEQGQQLITQALIEAVSTGALPDSEEMAEAINAVKAGIDKGNYDSKFAEDRAKLVLAGQLEQLKALGLDQKTDAELQLEALNAQLTALDTILETAQAQVDAIKGVDTAVLTVSAALAALATAISNAQNTAGTTPGGIGGGGGGGAGSTNPTIANKGLSSGITKDYTGVFNSGSVSQKGGKYTYTSTVTDSGGFAGIQNPSDTLTSSKPWTTTGYAANNKDVVDYYNANKAVIAQLGQATSLADYLNYHFITYGISENRKFAKGGIFDNGIVTAPTIFDAAMMGENGEEAIMPLGKMPDGSLGVRGTGGNDAELIAEIRNLKAELTHMKQYVAKTSTSTEESRKLLDEVVRGGSAITVESEIASY